MAVAAKRRAPAKKAAKKRAPAKKAVEARPGQEGRQAGSGTEGREAGSGTEGRKEAGSCQEGGQAGSGTQGRQEAGSGEEGGRSGLRRARPPRSGLRPGRRPSGPRKAVKKRAPLSGRRPSRSGQPLARLSRSGDPGQEGRASCPCPQGGEAALSASFPREHARPGAFGPPAPRGAPVRRAAELPDVGRPVDVIGQVGVPQDPDGEAEPRRLGAVRPERAGAVGEAEVAMPPGGAARWCRRPAGREPG